MPNQLRVGTAGTAAASASGGSGNYSYSVSGTSGFTIDRSTGAVSWGTALAAGAFNVTVTVNDGVNRVSVTERGTVTSVQQRADNTPPTVTATGGAGTLGATWNAIARATGYRVYVSPQYRGLALPIRTTGTSFSLSNVPAGRYRVSVIPGPLGSSGQSSVVTVT